MLKVTVCRIGDSWRCSWLVGCLACARSRAGPAARKLANDPVAKALGPAVINAAIKEGAVNLYSGTTTRDFLQNGGQAKFEKRFGIKIKPLTSELRKLVDRIRTEISVGRVVADIFEGNDQYMLELHRLNALAKWKPPAPELDRISKEAFVVEPAGYWWPTHVSAQGLVVNPNLVDPEGDQVPTGTSSIRSSRARWRSATRARRAAAPGTCSASRTRRGSAPTTS